MKPFRLGIIGTGFAARVLHRPALWELSDRWGYRLHPVVFYCQLRDGVALSGLVRR